MRLFPAMAVELFVWTILASFWLVNCASFSDKGKLNAFEQATKNYRYAMLLSNFEEAKNLSAPDSSIDLAALKNFHVVSYTPKKIEFSSDKSKVSQIVEIEYYRVDSMRQKIIRDVQEWTYQPETEQWILKSGLPEFN